MKRNLIAFLIMTAFAGQAFAAQHDYSIANGPGATVRADINDAYSAIASNNSGATEPSSTFANMWWMDTSTNILKQRTNANDAWVNVALKSGSGWVPYRNGTQLGDAATLTLDTSGTLSANSDSRVATQKATKTYTDTKISKTTSGELNALTEKTSVVSGDLFLIEDSAASYAKKKVQAGNILSNSRIQIFTSSGTFTAPTGVTKVYATLVGGGGGGGGATNAGVQAAGGGAGGSWIINRPHTVVPGNNYTVTIAAAATGGADQNTDGSPGGTTSFDTISAVGGNGGIRNTSGGTGGTATGGLNASTTTGGAGTMSGGVGGTRNSGTSGAGGSTPFGVGPDGVATGVGTAGPANTGCGGSGAGGSGSGDKAGGNGGTGIVILMY